MLQKVIDGEKSYICKVRQNWENAGHREGFCSVLTGRAHGNKLQAFPV